MTKKENKKSNQVVRDMKECFRSFNLPVESNEKNKEMGFLFTSQICNDHVCAHVGATYDWQKRYAGIVVVFHIPVPLKRVQEILRLLSLLNGPQSLYGYILCPCCNVISMQTGLFLSGKTLSKSKHSRLIRTLLEDSYLTFPLIEEVINGANFSDACDRFMDDHEDFPGKSDIYTEATKKVIIDDVRSALADEMFNFVNESWGNDAYVHQYQYPTVDGLNFVLGLTVRGEAIVLSMSAAFTVQEEKKDIIIDLVNRINKVCIGNHMYFSHAIGNVVLLSGVMLENGSLDKEELKHAFSTLLGNGFRVIPIIHKQLTSTESPETVIHKAFNLSQDGKECH